MKVKIELAKLRALLPRDAAGDPCFGTLEEVLLVFTPAEVVTLLNRALYQLEYQHQAHKVRAARERERTKALRLQVRKMFGVSWAKVTDEQLAKAMEALGGEGVKM